MKTRSEMGCCEHTSGAQTWRKDGTGFQISIAKEHGEGARGVIFLPCTAIARATMHMTTEII